MCATEVSNVCPPGQQDLPNRGDNYAPHRDNARTIRTTRASVVVGSKGVALKRL